jgi:hypothetical protein
VKAASCSFFKSNMRVNSVYLQNVIRHKLFVHKREAVLTPTDVNEIPNRLPELNLGCLAYKKHYFGVYAGVLGAGGLAQAILSHCRL